MRLFWITPECPYPANTGGRIGIWKRIEYLSSTNEIYLYSICDSDTEYSFVYDIEKVCKKVCLFRRKSKCKAIIGSFINPYPAESRWNKDLKKTLYIDAQNYSPDYVVVDFPQMIGVLPRSIIKTSRIVLNQHNIEYQTMISLAKGMKGISKFCYTFVSKQMEKYEKKIYNSKDIFLYTFVSLRDKRFFEDKYGLTNTLLVPVGAEIEEKEIITEVRHNLLFVGKMSYPANEEAAIWLITQVLPFVKEKFKDIKLYIVGKDPQTSLISVARGNDSVVVTGTVDSVDPYYDLCDIVVAPIFKGGGVNVKLFEALGKGKYVVTTSKGIEGTEIEDKIHVKVANDPRAFAEYCIDYISNPLSDTNRAIRNRSLEIMKKKYSWKAIVSMFEKVLLSEIENTEYN